MFIFDVFFGGGGRSQQCLCMVLGKCWENSVEANSRSHLLLLLESPSADRTGQVSGQKPGASFRPCCPSLWASHPLTGLFPGPARGSLAWHVRWQGQGHGHTHSSPCSVPVDVTCAFGCRRESELSLVPGSRRVRAGGQCACMPAFGGSARPCFRRWDMAGRHSGELTFRCVISFIFHHKLLREVL